MIYLSYVYVEYTLAIPGNPVTPGFPDNFFPFNLS